MRTVIGARCVPGLLLAPSRDVSLSVVNRMLTFAFQLWYREVRCWYLRDGCSPSGLDDEERCTSRHGWYHCSTSSFRSSCLTSRLTLLPRRFTVSSCRCSSPETVSRTAAWKRRPSYLPVIVSRRPDHFVSGLRPARRWSFRRPCWSRCRLCHWYRR